MQQQQQKSHIFRVRCSENGRRLNSFAFGYASINRVYICIFVVYRCFTEVIIAHCFWHANIQWT